MSRTKLDSVQRVRVAADGVAVAGESTVTGEATYALGKRAYRVTLTYRLTDLMVRSHSVPGRALLPATALDLVLPGAASPVTHRILRVHMSAVGCTAPDGSGSRACGRSRGQGWQVDLAADQAEERLNAQGRARRLTGRSASTGPVGTELSPGCSRSTVR